MNSYIFVNGVEIYKFKANNSEINAAPLCLGNVYDFSVDYDRIGIGGILDIHKYKMKKIWYKIMFRLIKQIFIALLSFIRSFTKNVFK